MFDDDDRKLLKVEIQHNDVDGDKKILKTLELHDYRFEHYI